MEDQFTQKSGPILFWTLLTTLTSPTLSGCTTQAWYESAQETQRQQCRQRYPDAADQQKCIDEVNSHTYNQYQQDRGDGAR